MTAPDLLIISGVAPGVTGVGQMVRTLLSEIRGNKKFKIKLVHGSSAIVRLSYWSKPLQIIEKIHLGKRVLDAVERGREYLAEKNVQAIIRSKTLENAKAVVLIHPPTLGLENCIRAIQKRKEKTWLYIVGTYFF
ncbi:MAG: hypothetical protein V1754_08585 [Pseudomonadota bacterium]